MARVRGGRSGRSASPTPTRSRPYAAALDRLRAGGLVYGCDCTRRVRRWAREADAGPGRAAPADAASAGCDGPVLRVALGGGSEAWTDLSVGPSSGPVAVGGDLAHPRSPTGTGRTASAWSSTICARASSSSIRGEDLRWMRRLLSCGWPGILGRAGDHRRFLHHPLIRRPDGRKLSKSAGDTGVRELRGGG